MLAFVGMCLCQQQPSQYQSQQQAGQQTRLEDIERDSLVAAAAFGQKSQQQTKSSPTAAPPSQQQQQQQQQYAYQTPQQQQIYHPQAVAQYVYQPQQQQFYVQPYQSAQQYVAQPYQMAFDYNGVQYMFVNPQTYGAANQLYQQQYYVPAAQPSAVPQYVTKQSSAAATVPAAAAVPASAVQTPSQEYKQQFSAVSTPAQVPQEYRQQSAAQADVSAKQQQYVAPAFQYVQQAAASGADFGYVTRHPAQIKASVPQQPQYQFVPQQYQQQPQQYQQQFYYVAPSAAATAPAEQPRPQFQLSAKSQFSSGVKSTTPAPIKSTPGGDFAYKYESSPQPYSTLRFSV